MVSKKERMITSIVLIIFLGSIVLYSRSEKAVLDEQTRLGKWLQDHNKESKIIGIVSIVISLILACLTLGLMPGIMIWLIVLMITLSLLIIFSPLKIVKYKSLLILFTFFLIVEIITLI